MRHCALRTLRVASTCRAWLLSKLRAPPGARVRNGENAGHWDDVLEEVKVRGSEWRIGNYQILQQIGRGGTGTDLSSAPTKFATHRRSEGILSVHADSRETLARFRREAMT